MPPQIFGGSLSQLFGTPDAWLIVDDDTGMITIAEFCRFKVLLENFEYVILKN